eukprot:scaffold846_cov168-Amphora_coffeaeformis.AAC.20
MNHLWFDFESIIANAFHNWDYVRSYDPSHRIERRPGFTESWGASSADHGEPAHTAAPPLGWSVTTATTQKSTSMPTIVQFRPAWAVQLALRTSGTDYQVINSSYAVTEACGPLPYLRDEKALVGGSSSRKILDYLVETKQVELAACESSHVKVAWTEEPLSVELLHELITETLADVLTVLRYQDRHTWKATERPRSLKAVHGNWFMGHWHVWAERHAALGSLHRLRTVEQAKGKAHRAYAILEQALQSSPQIFLDRKFSLAGLALFEHIMHALADSHLVTILHHYPALCRYGQKVWEEYFAEGTCQITVAKNAAAANAKNPFFVLPTMDTWKSVVPLKDDSSWQERLATLAREAAASVKPRPMRTATATTEDTTTPSRRNTESTAEAAVAAYQTADQRWIASVLLVVVVAIARTIGQGGGEGETD